MIWLWVVIGLVVLAALFIWATYNGLVKLKVRVEEAWSDITVQLKRRADLIPNLIETVKGYAAHEKEVFQRVTEARTAVMDATSKGPAETAKAENQFEGALKSLFAVAEAYPDLKANQNMMQLTEELTSTENKVAFARQHYNDAVTEYNTYKQTFPPIFFAGILGHAQDAELLDFDDAQINEAPKISF